MFITVTSFLATKRHQGTCPRNLHWILAAILMFITRLLSSDTIPPIPEVFLQSYNDTLSIHNDSTMVLQPGADSVSTYSSSSEVFKDSGGTNFPGAVDTVIDTSASKMVDSIVPEIAPAAVLTDSIPHPLSPDAPGEVEDTTKLDIGTYFAVGFGWALGDFALTTFWENSLPKSLEDLGLTDSSFREEVDSNSTEALHMSDTALLVFSTKEKPSMYTMCFPIALSLIKITDNRRLSLSLIGSWMHKINTTTVGLRNDTTHLQCDYKESINVYSLFLSVTYGQIIPKEYFTIDGIEKCFFVCGIDLSPLIVTTISTSIKVPDDYQRLQEIKQHLKSPGRFFHGSAIALRTGLSMVKRINKKSGTDAGFYYTIQGYGYFFEDGTRSAFNDIDPTHKKKERPLFWISNRFELSISLLRYHK